MSVRVISDDETAHQHPINRLLHLIGIPLIIVSSLAAVSPWRLFGWPRHRAVGGLLAGWGLLFIGHGIEGTQPVILSRPSLSGRAIARWLGQLRTGFPGRPKARRVQTVAEVAENLRQAEGDLDLPGEL